MNSFPKRGAHSRWSQRLQPDLIGGGQLVYLWAWPSVFFPQPQGCSLPFLLVSASFITRKGKERKFLSQFCSSLATLWRHFAERGWNGITQVEDSEPAVIRMIWVFSLSDRLILDIEAWPDDENKHKFEKPKPTNQCGPVLRWSFHLTLLRFQPWFHWGIKANDILSHGRSLSYWSSVTYPSVEWPFPHHRVFLIFVQDLARLLISPSISLEMSTQPSIDCEKKVNFLMNYLLKWWSLAKLQVPVQ